MFFQYRPLNEGELKLLFARAKEEFKDGTAPHAVPLPVIRREVADLFSRLMANTKVGGGAYYKRIQIRFSYEEGSTPDSWALWIDGTDTDLQQVVSVVDRKTTKTIETPLQDALKIVLPDILGMAGMPIEEDGIPSCAGMLEFSVFDRYAQILCVTDEPQADEAYRMIPIQYKYPVFPKSEQ